MQEIKHRSYYQSLKAKANRYFRKWQNLLSVLDLIDRKLEAGKVDEAREIIGKVRNG